MRFAIHVEQLRGVDVRVALRRADARVAEKLLNGAQIGAALQQVRRERMPQRVRTDPRARAARGDVTPHEAIDAAHGEPRAAVVHKQRIAPTYVVSGFSRTAAMVRLNADATYRTVIACDRRPVFQPYAERGRSCRVE